MTPEEITEAMAAGIQQAHQQESPINPQNIFYALGVAAVAFVGWSFNSNQEEHGEKLDTLTEAVGKLVMVSETQQNELGKRGVWMDGVDTYSQQSLIKDTEHDAAIEANRKEIETLKRMMARQ